MATTIVSFRACKADGEPLTNRRVKLYKGDKYSPGKTDDSGRCSIEWSHSWLDGVDVDGEYWDMQREIYSESGRVDLGELRAQKQSESFQRNEETGWKEVQPTSIRGQLFYSDGTMCSQHKEIKILVHDEMFTSGSTGDGDFNIEIRSNYRDPRGFFQVQAMFVEGNEIPRYHRFVDHQGYWHVVMPRSQGKAGSRGGMISGQVVDSDNLPLADTRVGGEVRSDSLIWGLLGGGDVYATRTNRHGQFALRFTGGVVLKKVLVNGEQPGEIWAGETSLTDQEIRAGSFGLVLRERKRFLGWFR